MNILFTHPDTFNPKTGGIGRVTDTLSKEFISTGHKIYYLNLRPDKYGDNYKYPAYVSILPTSQITDIKNVKFYHQFLHDNTIEIIINQDGLYEGAHLFLNTGNNPVAKISVLHSNPLLEYEYLWQSISSLRDDTIKEKFKRIARCILYKKIKKRLWNSLISHYTYIRDNSDAVVILSEHYKTALKKLNIQIEKKCHVIPNPNTYNNVDNLPDKQNEILYVGRLDKNKNIFRLLKIWEKLCNQYNNWHLSIVGDGPEKHNLIKYTTSKDIKNVTFYGFQDPQKYYIRASIICLTSTFEGFPMMLSEGMQFGCVPISFRSFDAITDIIIPTKTGELVTPFKIKEYRDKLDNLIKNETYRKQLSANAFNYIKKFNLETTIKLWNSTFSQIKATK